MKLVSIFKHGLIGLLFFIGSLSQAQVLDQIIAVANDDVITQQELNTRVQMVKNQYRNNPSVLPSDAVLSQQVLDALILESLQLQLADKAKIVIPDQQVDTALRTIANNQNMTLPQFLTALSNSGRDVDAFRDQVRREITIDAVQKKIVGRQIYVSDTQVDRFLASQAGQSLKQTEYRLIYLRFELTEKEQASKLLAELNGGATLFSNPDSRDLGLRELEQIPSIFRTLVPVLNLNEAVLIERNNALHMAQLTEKSTTQSLNIEEFIIRHILITTDALIDSSSAQALLNNLRDQIIAGASFADLANQYSDDTGSKGRGGLLDWSTLDNYVSEFSDAAKNTPFGEISQVFQSPYGFHILRLEDSRMRDVSVDVLRNQIRNQISQRLYNESLQRWKAELRAESFVELRTE